MFGVVEREMAHSLFFFSVRSVHEHLASGKPAPSRSSIIRGESSHLVGSVSVNRPTLPQVALVSLFPVTLT